jgi:hypothetical protein
MRKAGTATVRAVCDFGDPNSMRPRTSVADRLMRIRRRKGVHVAGLQRDDLAESQPDPSENEYQDTLTIGSSRDRERRERLELVGLQETRLGDRKPGLRYTCCRIHCEATIGTARSRVLRKTLSAFLVGEPHWSRTLAKDDSISAISSRVMCPR